MPLILTVKPHVEPGGYHRDRFDAYLPDGELLLTGREILRPAARMLLERGYDPSVTLTMQTEGAPYPSFLPRPIGAWAEEALTERDRGGFQVRRWEPWGGPWGKPQEAA